MLKGKTSVNTIAPPGSGLHNRPPGGGSHNRNRHPGGGRGLRYNYMHTVHSILIKDACGMDYIVDAGHWIFLDQHDGGSAIARLLRKRFVPCCFIRYE